MEITVSTQQGKVPVTVVQPHGDVDASNYAELVNKVEALIKDGAKDFLIDLVGFGLIIPILPYYAQRLGVGGLGFGALIGTFSLMQFVATIVLGRLSDRLGRRPILLVTILFSFTGYLVFAFAGSYLVLFLARSLAGFAAGNISVAQAYIADITTQRDRSRGMGLIGAAFGGS